MIPPHRFVPVTTMSTSRLPHCEHTSRRAPFRHWRLWPIPACLLGRVRFTPVTTCFAPDGKPELGRGDAFECHRRAAAGGVIAIRSCRSDQSKSLTIEVASAAKSDSSNVLMHPDVSRVSLTSPR